MFKKMLCRHEFYGWDLKSRDRQGLVSWACYKCGKIFKEKCGLDVLTHGECRGGWGITTEEEREQFKEKE